MSGTQTWDPQRYARNAPEFIEEVREALRPNLLLIGSAKLMLARLLRRKTQLHVIGGPLSVGIA